MLVLPERHAGPERLRITSACPPGTACRAKKAKSTRNYKSLCGILAARCARRKHDSVKELQAFLHFRAPLFSGALRTPKKLIPQGNTSLVTNVWRRAARARNVILSRIYKYSRTFAPHFFPARSARRKTRIHKEIQVFLLQFPGALRAP